MADLQVQIADQKIKVINLFKSRGDPDDFVERFKSALMYPETSKEFSISISLPTFPSENENEDWDFYWHVPYTVDPSPARKFVRQRYHRRPQDGASTYGFFSRFSVIVLFGMRFYYECASNSPYSICLKLTRL